MPSSRYFFDGPINLHQEVVIEGQESKHLLQVMRTQIGESVELINGRGALFSASLKSIEKKTAYLTVDKLLKKEESYNQKMILVQALPKFKNLEWIVEKAVELGAFEIQLFIGKKSEKKSLSNQQKIRLEHLLIAAIKQCGRLYLPKITYKDPIKTWQKEKEGRLFFGAVGEKSLFLAAKDLDSRKNFFCIGPEAGFSREEEMHLQKIGALSISLHPNVLRCETAAITALSQASLYLFS